MRGTASSRKKSDDSDLDALLSGSEAQAGRNGGSTAAAINLDHLTTGKVSVTPQGSPGKGYNGGYGNSNRVHYHQLSIIDFCQSYVAMLCHYYPMTCTCCTVSALLALLLLLAAFVFNPTQQLGIVHHHSQYDLNLSQVDHWCLRGGDDNCKCEDPLVPMSRSEHLSWVQALDANKKMLQKRLAETPDVNIAFVGESVVEAMGGRWMGSQRNAKIKQLATTFKHHFIPTDADQKALNGVALGIAGDTAPNVLWRLNHGELPDNLQPKIFWVSIGMNDLSRMECSEEIVVLGILRVVEELLAKRPKAHVVINSVFPMASIRGGAYPVASDFQDAFKPIKGQNRQLAAIDTHHQEEESVTSSTAHLRVARSLRKGRKKQGPDLKSMTPEQRAEYLEELRDKKYRRQHRMENRQKRRPANPKLQNRKRVKKYNILRPKPTNFPFWSSITAINHELRQFANEQHNVHYFDANPIFVQSGPNSRQGARLNGRLITMRGHPTPTGFALWEDAVQKDAVALLEEMRVKEPELFETPVAGGLVDGIRDWFFGEDDSRDSDDAGEDDNFGDSEEDLYDSEQDPPQPMVISPPVIPEGKLAPPQDSASNDSDETQDNAPKTSEATKDDEPKDDAPKKRPTKTKVDSKATKDGEPKDVAPKKRPTKTKDATKDEGEQNDATKDSAD